MSKQPKGKRGIFAELVEGVGAMKDHREGKVTLRTHKLPVAEVKESPGAEFFVAARQKFNVSRSVWASMLHVSPRTVEKWEQGGQVSPLAATFVELVSEFPDTIERLQTLPKRVARPGGSITYRSRNVLRFKRSAVAHGQSAWEQLRSRYRPKNIRVLFVGEAPPEGGTFFYAENSQLYRHLRETLQPRLGDPPDFLKAFCENGYFLDDLAAEPVESLPVTERASILKRSIPLLAKKLVQYQPEVVITLLKRISGYVEDAISLAGLDVHYHSVPFPGNGQQANFRQVMERIVPLLP